MGFVNRMNQNMAKYRIGIRMKKGLLPAFVWKVDVVLQGVWVLYHIKDEGSEYLLILAFGRDAVHAIFLKYSKEGRLSSSQVRIRNILLDVYDDTKHYQLQTWWKTRQG